MIAIDLVPIEIDDVAGDMRMTVSFSLISQFISHHKIL